MQIVLSVQKAVFELLVGGDIDADVYDFVPDNAAYPYVTIGQINASDNSNVNVKGYKLQLAIDVFSELNGRLECLTVIEAIRGLLDRQQIAVDGFVFIACNFVSMNTERLGDGTINGVVNFSLLIRDEM